MWRSTAGCVTDSYIIVLGYLWEPAGNNDLYQEEANCPKGGACDDCSDSGDDVLSGIVRGGKRGAGQCAKMTFTRKNRGLPREEFTTTAGRTGSDVPVQEQSLLLDLLAWCFWLFGSQKP